MFTKNRDRLLRGDIAAKFFRAVLGQPEVKVLLSDEHFTVDGTLIEAWASMKSFKPKDETGGEPPTGGAGRNAERDFHGEKRTNATHASTTDPDARLIRRGRGKEAKLCHMGHLLMENQSGLIIDTMLTPATGTAERDAAEAMLARPGGAPPGDTWCRQRLRHQGLRCRRPCPQRHAPRRADHRAPLGDRPPDDAPSRLRGEPAGP